LKVLHVYKDFYPPVKGGIECHINLLARGLKTKGVEVEVLVSNTSNRFEQSLYHDITVSKAPQWGRLVSAPITPTFFRYLKERCQSTDIVHFHYPNPTAELSYLLANSKKKLVVSYHSDIVRQAKLGLLYTPFRKMFLTACDRIIASSGNYIKSSSVLQAYAHKCTVIPYGIDTDRFNTFWANEESKSIRSRYGKEPILLFVGRFRYYKGLHVLISAMKKVEARLLLIGTGPEEKRLRKMVQKEQLEKRIDFLGDLPDEDVDAFYNACDIFILPSHLRSEAFGIVQIEAMCCQKPVICTELGTGTSYANIDNKTGITVPPDDVSALTDAINSLLHNPQKREEMGACGAHRVRKLFSAEKMVDQTLNVYLDLIKQP
jgi:rhamnosyl/mannosyltransferase